MLLSKKRKFDLESLNGKLERKNVYKNFFLFMMGMAISAISVSVFFKPNNIVTGGSTGLAILITNYIDIDLSLVIFVISSIISKPYFSDSEIDFKIVKLRLPNCMMFLHINIRQSDYKLEQKFCQGL